MAPSEAAAWRSPAARRVRELGRSCVETRNRFYRTALKYQRRGGGGGVAAASPVRMAGAGTIQTRRA